MVTVTRRTALQPTTNTRLLFACAVLQSTTKGSLCYYTQGLYIPRGAACAAVDAPADRMLGLEVHERRRRSGAGTADIPRQTAVAHLRLILPLPRSQGLYDLLAHAEAIAAQKHHPFEIELTDGQFEPGRIFFVARWKADHSPRPDLQKAGTAYRFTSHILTERTRAEPANSDCSSSTRQSHTRQSRILNQIARV